MKHLRGLEKDISLILCTFTEIHEARRIASLVIGNLEKFEKKQGLDLKAAEDSCLLLHQHLYRASQAKKIARLESFEQHLYAILSQFTSQIRLTLSRAT